MDEGEKKSIFRCLFCAHQLVDHTFHTPSTLLRFIIGCFKQCSGKDCPGQIVFLLLPSLSPPRFVNEAVQHGLLWATWTHHCDHVCKTLFILGTDISKSYCPLITDFIYFFFRAMVVISMNLFGLIDNTSSTGTVNAAELCDTSQWLHPHEQPLWIHCSYKNIDMNIDTDNSLSHMSMSKLYSRPLSL